MWQTQDEKKLLLCAQLFQQWLQVAAATLYLEELEKQERREREEMLDEDLDDRERNGSDSGCSEDQCTAIMRSSCMN